MHKDEFIIGYERVLNEVGAIDDQGNVTEESLQNLYNRPEFESPEDFARWLLRKGKELFGRED